MARACILGVSQKIVFYFGITTIKQIRFQLAVKTQVLVFSKWRLEFTKVGFVFITNPIPRSLIAMLIIIKSVEFES